MRSVTSTASTAITSWSTTAIACLMSALETILLPSLSKARDSAVKVQCAGFQPCKQFRLATPQ
jgi:hypothetical protein